MPHEFPNVLPYPHPADNTTLAAMENFRCPLSNLAPILNRPENNILRLRETTKNVTFRTPKSAPLKLPIAPNWNTFSDGDL